MGDQRKPRMLTDEQIDSIIKALADEIEDADHNDAIHYEHGHFDTANEYRAKAARLRCLLDDLGADPVPWVTVDDTGRPVRMEQHHVELHESEDSRHLPLFRAVPLDEEGGQ